MNITNEQLDCMIEKYVAGFQKLIYEQDPDFQKRMKENMLADDDPSKPLLTLSFLGEYLKEEKYLSVCREWAEWIYRDFPRTQEGGRFVLEDGFCELPMIREAGICCVSILEESSALRFAEDGRFFQNCYEG